MALERVKSTETSDGFLLNRRRPTVVVPDQFVSQCSDAHETARAMELARHQMDETTFSRVLSSPPSAVNTTDKYAFAFDIDGVLIKGGEVIPEAKDALKMLNGQNALGIKVPYIFVTNGGGKTEEERCIQLSNQLDIEVSPGQFICGHTPMREMAEKYQCVLVIGGEGEKCRHVAEGYGFQDVITPGDIIKTQNSTTPFRKLTDEEEAHSRVRDFSKLQIGAIFVFADSRDWAGDQQVIMDVLTSRDGYLGTKADEYEHTPPIYFAHNDAVWATSHSSSRIGMGVLRANVESTFQLITGHPLKTIAFGKPQLGTFEFATRLLQQWRKDTHGINAPPETVYFVGDTPESDIRGTNEFDKHATNKWYSILVRSGVFQEGTKPRFTPQATVDNVLEAVKHGMERELKRMMHAESVAVSSENAITEQEENQSSATLNGPTATAVGA